MNLEVFACTYNIDAQKPPAVSELAQHWLQAHRFPVEAKTTGTPLQTRSIDIYTIGLQEVKHFEDGDDHLVFEMENQDLWEAALLAATNWSANGAVESDPFVLLHRVVYSSVMYVAYARKSLLDKTSGLLIDNVNVMTHKLHDAGMTGKKGVCGIEFEVINANNRAKTTVALMTGHFQAYNEKLDERLWDSIQVCTALQWPSKLATPEHDTAILMGDLNFRIVLPIEEVKEKIAQNDLVPLLHADELFMNTRGCVVASDGTVSLAEEPVFPGWKEAPVTFKPTYKFVNGTDRWDDSGKQRTPAWCDRVLTHGRAETTFYSSAGALMISDHRPVLALITVPIN